MRRVISIHNNPENLQLPAKYARLQFALADVDTQDISPYFAPSYDFIEEARAAGHGAPATHGRETMTIKNACMLKFRLAGTSQVDTALFLVPSGGGNCCIAWHTSYPWQQRVAMAGL